MSYSYIFSKQTNKQKTIQVLSRIFWAKKFTWFLHLVEKHIFLIFLLSGHYSSYYASIYSHWSIESFADLVSSGFDWSVFCSHVDLLKFFYYWLPAHQYYLKMIQSKAFLVRNAMKAAIKMAGSRGALQVECKFAYKVKHSCKVRAAPWCCSTQLEF